MRVLPQDRAQVRKEEIDYRSSFKIITLLTLRIINCKLYIYQLSKPCDILIEIPFIAQFNLEMINVT